MENQKSLTLPTSNHVVAYGYNQKFYLTDKQAEALVAATEQGLKIVKFKDKILSTNYSWIAPIEQVEQVELNSKELAFAEQIAEWIARPVNNPNMNYHEALNYTKKLINDKGLAEVRKLWNVYANGAYPSVVRFFIAAKNDIV